MKNEVLKVGDKTYLLAFDMNTLCKMESDGIDVLDLDKDAMPFTMIRRMFYYAAMKFHKKEIKNLDKAGDVIQDCIDEGITLQEIMTLSTKALSYATGSNKQTKEEIEEEETTGK
jgi:hypothetical protein